MNVRVFVVDDAAFIRKAMARVLASDRSIRIVGEAADGAEALEKIPLANPDVVTLDVDMPGMDGLSTLRHLMKIRPGLPVIMLSALTREGGATTLEALASGAVDFIDKSSLNVMDFGRLAEELHAKIKLWGPNGKKRSGRGVAARRSARAGRKARRARVEAALVEWSRYELCVIGASTGGPLALETIVRAMPRGFPVPIAIVQHMPIGFTRPFAERLDLLSELWVSEAVDGDHLSPGTVKIAPAGQHLRIGQNLEIQLSREPASASHTPSVDVMMQSAARSRRGQVVGILLTGMGEDGAVGMRSILDRGGLTIAENEETCVVAGMPKAAYLRGGVSLYVPLYEIVRAFHHGQ